MPCISVVIITYNEERNIERCLQSVLDIADEIVVVDSYSTDRTEEICYRYRVRFLQHPFEGYIEQKNWATAQAKFDHILFLDADEALSDELKKSIKYVKDNWTHDGYTFNRLTNYCGHWIHHTSWYPSKKLRLYDRRKGKWDGINPHDQFVMYENTQVKHLKGDLLHYSYYTIEQQISQINNFTEIIARSYHQKGLIPLFGWHVLFHPLWRFFRDYIIKLGFLDGFYGFIVSLNGSYEVFLKYLKVYQQIRTERKESPFRICFYFPSKDWGTQEEHMFRYMLSLHQSGLSVSVAAPAGSPALYKAKEARVYFYKIGFTNQNLLSALFFARYLRVYRIGSVISGEQKAPSYAMLCARLARMPHLLVHQVSISEVEQPISFRHFYYKKEVQTFAAESNLNVYIHVLNFYKLIANSNFVQTPGQFSFTSMDKTGNKTREKDTVKNSE